MVDIVESYQKLFAGNMYPSQLLAVLKGEDPDIRVKGVSNGVILFSNSKNLKCVNSYYENLQGTQPQLSRNFFLSCRHIRECLGIDSSVGDACCKECHQHCLLLLQSHKIKRKKNRKRRRKLYEKS